MKKVLSVLCAILLVSAMTVAAFAENIPSPSVEVPVVVDVVATDKDGNVVDIVVDETTLSIASIADKEALPEETKAALDEAYAAMDAAASIEEILPECAGMEVVDIQCVQVSDEIAAFMEEGGTVSVKMDLKMEIPEGATMKIVRFIDGKWVESEEAVEILEDGTVVLHLNQPGIFALLVG